MKILIILSIVSFYSLVAQDSTYLTPIVPDFQVNFAGDSTSYCCSPSICVDGDGNFVVTWIKTVNDTSDIYAQRFSSEATRLGDDFRVNDIPGSTEYWHSHSIASYASGNFIVAWVDKRNAEFDIYAQRFSNEGIKIGNNFRVNNTQGNVVLYSSVSVSADSIGNFVITWSGNGNIFAQRYTNEGMSQGNNFRVNDTLASVWYSNLSPVVAVSPSGDFAISWQGYGMGNIYAQRYSSDGIPLGDNFRVDESPYNDITHGAPSISWNSRENLVITWSYAHSNIFAQRYSNDGIAIENNFAVNNVSIMKNSSTSVCSDKNGNFVIVWEDGRNDTSDIYMQKYSNDGRKIGNNFRITNNYDGNQHSPDVKLWNGLIYTTWVDNNNIWVNALDGDFPTDIKHDFNASLPTDFYLSQNFPNPFNPATIIQYSIPVAALSAVEVQNVSLKVYDILGREVATLVNQKQKPGNYEVTWDASNKPSGIYFYKLTAGDFVETKKMILLR